MPSSSTVGASGTCLDAGPALLAVVIAHQTLIATEHAATVRDVRRARAANRAQRAVAGALAELERVILPDRALWAADRSRASPLPVPGTITPAERAWVLGGHLLAATARLHSRASQAGRPRFGERETARALVFIGEALPELCSLVAPDRRAELRAAFAPDSVSLDAQLGCFAQLLVGRGTGAARCYGMRGAARRT